MGFDFGSFGDEQFSEAFVDWMVDDRWVDIGLHFGRLWNYYHNSMHDVSGAGGIGRAVNESSSGYVQSQEQGLPSRITGMVYSSRDASSGRRLEDVQRKEVVIENDIGWRINAMVDFLFGKGVVLVSKASDVGKRREIEQIIKAVFSSNGGIRFFQDMAVLGSVYGFVDCVVRPGEEVFHKVNQSGLSEGGSLHFANSLHTSSFESILQRASQIGLELLEAPRVLPVLDENDYRKIRYYVQNFYQQKNEVKGGGGFLSRLLGRTTDGKSRQVVMVTEVTGPGFWQRYENKELVAEGDNVLGLVPVVHVQNVAQPYYYEGISDVEQLIGLQDELNTRLSDRAYRTTFQAFKMYLAKGLEGFENKPVSPGRMWCTSNPDASIEAFGGDAASPSEDRHIREIREAMDKVSGVTPVVAGVLKNKIGNLTSGVALKMTFMGMLARTARKQLTYGEGLKDICRLVLRVLDVCRVYPTKPSEREIEVQFPSPLPENMMERLEEARIKKELGVPEEKVLEELGY
jgi:hypothetical protein